VKGLGFRQRNEHNDAQESKFGLEEEFGGSGFRKRNAHRRKRNAYIAKNECTY